jgi:protein-tyrosine phosphatase
VRSTLYRIEVAGPGSLATMAKPRGDDWLDDEMAALAEAGIDVLVCAMPAAERAEVGLSGEPAAARASGLTFVDIPIADLTVPDHRSVRPALDDLADRFRRGASIVTHCRFGIGRASLLATSVLVLTGVAPQDAWRRVEAARGRPVPDTPEQREWVAGLL